jgi:hypothetical protein
VDYLHVNRKLTTMVTNDEHAHAATAGLEGFGEAGPKVGLVDDGEGLLNITSLGHCDDCHAISILLRSRRRMDKPEPSWRSRTRYCLKTGPNIV